VPFALQRAEGWWVLGLAAATFGGRPPGSEGPRLKSPERPLFVAESLTPGGCPNGRTTDRTTTATKAVVSTIGALSKLGILGLSRRSATPPPLPASAR
jgi:hypothetical protein